MTEAQINQEQEWEIDNLPNRLTIFRILLVPVVIGALFLCSLKGEWIEKYHNLFGYIAAWTFVGASITDFFDGYIARKRGIVTVFGSFLDPIADKFLVVSSLILLDALGRVHPIIVVILVLREMYITSLRLLAKERGFNVPVGKFGKWKTATQMLAIPFLMAYDYPFGIPMPLIGTTLIVLASIFSLYSALEYSTGLLKKFKAHRKEKKRIKNEGPSLNEDDLQIKE
ncbi:CDP-diacylglycerol--glycerol-3-phosphate 3-phosphatidyltransferase [Halobacteriovorax sp. GB3]|uniref:CDP-diacylglycerol--glycerol-3-phosphate 3-phosphatidyltransferase n=1 Tax=Halobacteriovorax sp. GB3 TaxID=2719615 RepID=UPI00235FE84A|nr:CDP-diacylglycerol--glycerol-3-phosphate 3-phosphatidyltransferase [Halobacteriovorax sp. GB3]MDD0853072.1 CDP-diacylglycerol--glycerol-3-phosphate 3-phosphatidyltransferase [Halobacteriovorax sp. GB3]